MEKKIYEKPIMQEERFVPNMYIASCQKDGVWQAKCRTGGSCLIFFGAGPDDWTSDACRGGCGNTHEFPWTDSTPPGPNCWLVTSVSITSSGHGSHTTYSINPPEYAKYFTGTISYDSADRHGYGLTLTTEGYNFFKGRNELKPGFYYRLPNGFNWLVTDDFASIKPLS